MNVHVVVGIALAALGIYFAVMGVLGGRQDHRRTAKTSGVVVDQQQRAAQGSRMVGNPNLPLTFPVVRVTLPGIGERTIVGSNGRNPPAHRVGETVAVTYDPRDPESAAVGSPGVVSGVLVAVGIVVAVAVVLIAIL